MMFTKLPHRTTLKKTFTHFKINIEKYIVFVKFNKNSLPQKHYSINNHQFSAIRLQCITLIQKILSLDTNIIHTTLGIIIHYVHVH